MRRGVPSWLADYRREILPIPLEQAKAQGWTVVSVKDDWTTVFADAPSPA